MPGGITTQGCFDAGRVQREEQLEVFILMPPIMAGARG